MRRDINESDEDIEGGGIGGGADITREYGVEPEPVSLTTLALTIVLVALVLAVPVLWAVGVYTGLAVVKGVSAAAQAGYLLLAVILFSAAALFFWAQFRRSA